MESIDCIDGFSPCHTEIIKKIHRFSSLLLDFHMCCNSLVLKILLLPEVSPYLANDSFCSPTERLREHEQCFVADFVLRIITPIRLQNISNIHDFH